MRLVVAVAAVGSVAVEEPKNARNAAVALAIIAEVKVEIAIPC